jgi:hypothetical protein
MLEDVIITDIQHIESDQRKVSKHIHQTCLQFGGHSAQRDIDD